MSTTQHQDSSDTAAVVLTDTARPPNRSQFALWTYEDNALVPQWTQDLNLKAVESLIRRRWRLKEEEICLVTSVGEGRFARVCKIEADNRTAIIRIVLPVEYHDKTASEVATMQYISQHTTVRIPTILDYSPHHNNEIGCEWVLMTEEGQNLSTVWFSWTDPQKNAAVEHLAGYIAQLFNRSRFRKIGNLYKQCDLEPSSSEDQSITVGRVVEKACFWGEMDREQPRNVTFQNSYLWLKHRLDERERQVQNKIAALRQQHNEAVQQSMKDNPGDDKAPCQDDIIKSIEDELDSHKMVMKLLRLLPMLFDSGAADEETCLAHDDLHINNILIDDSGDLTIIDWECVSAVPLWCACRMLAFLRGPIINSDKANLSSSTGESNNNAFDYDEEHNLLVSVFLSKMQLLAPEWVAVHQNEQARDRRTFECAVASCQADDIFMAECNLFPLQRRLRLTARGLSDNA